MSTTRYADVALVGGPFDGVSTTVAFHGATQLAMPVVRAGIWIDRHVYQLTPDGWRYVDVESQYCPCRQCYEEITSTERRPHA